MFNDGGSEAARRFKAEVMPHLDTAYNLARWLTGNSADADDVIQEAAMRAYRFVQDLESGKAKPWLLQIVRNTAYSWLKKNRNFVALSEAHENTTGHSTPESELIGKVAAQHLHQALSNMPVEYREALILRELEDLSYREIAEVTGLAEGTVMSRLSRARAHLKLNLRKEKS